jgi:hypothetical protein
VERTGKNIGKGRAGGWDGTEALSEPIMWLGVSRTEKGTTVTAVFVATDIRNTNIILKETNLPCWQNVKRQDPYIHVEPQTNCNE